MTRRTAFIGPLLSRILFVSSFHILAPLPLLSPFCLSVNWHPSSSNPESSSAT
jgi:hypothetical protein